MTKLIYICHQFGGEIENKKKVEELIRGFVEIYPDFCFISPIHSFGYLYNDVDYDTGMDYCLTLLDLCDEMWTFGNFSDSRGCTIEKSYCKRYKIPIIEMR